MGRSWAWTLRVLFLASLLLLCSALPPLPPSPPPSLRRGSGTAAEVAAADEALLARMCDPRGSPPAWCHELRLRRRRGRRHHHRRTPPPVPLPPPGPGRDDGGEEIDMRYGVAKRRVPTGPNPLHN